MMSVSPLAARLGATLLILSSAPSLGDTAPSELSSPAARTSEAGSSAADTGIFRAAIGGKRVLLPSMTVAGAQFVSLKAIAAAAGATILQGARPGDVTLDLLGRRIVFSADDPSLVSFDGGAATLTHPARPVRDDLYVPSPFIARVFAPMVDEEPAVTPGKSGEARIDLKMIGDSETLRLVFECPRRMPFEMKELTKSVVLRIADAGAVPPYTSRAIGSPLLRSISFDTSPRNRLDVRMEKGDGFERASASTLENPYRIVVELHGTARLAPAGRAVETLPASPEGRLSASPPVTLPGGPPARRTLRTVVIDPGHGGEQQGALGSGGLLEKEVTLDIGRRLRQLLREAGLSAILTRDWDYDLPLIDRTAVANREKADLFISIHVNSSPRRDARGAETYYLAYQTADAESEALAAIENAPAGGAAREREGIGVDVILWDLAQAEHLRESSELAEIVQRELNDALGLRDRGVRQAPFLVLMGATMPAILVEVGFVSNPSEEAELKTSGYRDRIALALTQAVLDFKRVFDLRQGVAPQ
jgi:N-acetylmuramoyl-L-alanine amidase